MSKVLVDRELLERIVNTNMADYAVIAYQHKEIRAILAQPAEAEGPSFAEVLEQASVIQQLGAKNKRIDELQTALLAVTAELDRMRSENDRLRSGVRGDFDLDAWLDWAKESDQLRAELQALRELVGQCVEYLNPGRKNSIASGSILHRALTAAVEGK